MREAGVPNVVVWKTLLYDPAAKLLAVRFWEIMTARSPNDNDSLRTAVRAAFEAAKLAVQTAVRPGGALDVGGGKTCAAAVPRAFTSCTIQSLGLRTPPLHGTARPKVAC